MHRFSCVGYAGKPRRISVLDGGQEWLQHLTTKTVDPAGANMLPRPQACFTPGPLI